VHGLTTAASLWLSAAVGVVIGGGMYFVGFFTVMVSVLVLRFGPRSFNVEGDPTEVSPVREARVRVRGVARPTRKLFVK
jgi:uncharacterized membrane protein YhiD involved in acid resistance